MPGSTNTDTTASRPSYGNWRLPSRPGIGPLGLLGSVVLLGGLILALLTALVSWIGALCIGVLIAATVIPLAVRTADGRSGFAIMAVRAGWLHRRVTGQTARMTGPLSREPGGRFRPPGLLTALQMIEGRDAYHRPFGVIHDPQLNTFTLALQCDPDGGALVDAEQVDTWVACWGGWLAGLAHEPGLVGAAVIVETAPDPGTRLAAEVLPRLDPAAPEPARALMGEIVAAYPAASSETSTWVTLTYRPASSGKISTHIERQADMVTNLAVRVPALTAGLTGAGGGAVHPMAADRIADAIRVAFDPSVAATVLQARAGSGSTGLGWDDTGPATATETADCYLHEGAVSRSWIACEAPRGTVRCGVLRSLLEPSPRIARKRVAVLYRPLSPAASARVVEADRRTAHFMAASTTGLVNARASTAVRAAEQTAAEEASGAGLVEFGLVATVTAAEPDGLRVADAEMANLAASARLRLRVARGQQAAAFAAGLPAGVLPWLHTLLPYQLRGAL